MYKIKIRKELMDKLNKLDKNAKDKSPLDAINYWLNYTFYTKKSCISIELYIL